MKSYVYSRVACDDDFSLEVQTSKLVHYAKRSGYTVIGAYSEYGSGLTLERPALQALTQAVIANRPDIVLVNNIFRIARRMEMVQAYIELLNKFEVDLLCLQDRLLVSKNGVTAI